MAETEGTGTPGVRAYKKGGGIKAEMERNWAIRKKKEVIYGFNWKAFGVIKS